MADLTTTYVATNYRKARPSFGFGTPELEFARVVATFDDSSDFSTDYEDANSIYAQAVNVIQGYVELYGVGIPTSDGFIIAYNANSAGDHDADGTEGGFGKIETNLVAVDGVATATLTLVKIEGVDFAVA